MRLTFSFTYTAVNNATSKSEIVVPQLHLPGAHVKQYTEKEDHTTYISSHADTFAYGTEEEERDEASVTTFKPGSISEEDESTVRESSATSVLDCEDRCSSVQSKVHYFENCFKQVSYYLLGSVPPKTT